MSGDKPKCGACGSRKARVRDSMTSRLGWTCGNGDCKLHETVAWDPVLAPTPDPQGAADHLKPEQCPECLRGYRMHYAGCPKYEEWRRAQDAIEDAYENRRPQGAASPPGAGPICQDCGHGLRASDFGGRCILKSCPKFDLLVPLFPPAPAAGQGEAVSHEMKYALHLVGSIYYYGGFKAETFAERELEKQLRKLGYFYKNESQVVENRLALFPENKHG